MYNTTLDVDLLREIKILAAQLELRQNDLIEEAIQDLIEKYKHRQMRVSNVWVSNWSSALENFNSIGILILGLVVSKSLILAMKNEQPAD